MKEKKICGNDLDRLESCLFNGDCVEVLKSLTTDSIDCILTDPPYNLGLFMHDRNTNLNKMRENQFAYAGWDNLEFEEWVINMKMFLSECARVIKIRGSLIVFMSVLKVSDFVKLAEEVGFYYKTTGIWHKTNPMPRNMKLQFVNSTECWIYMTYKSTSGTFHNNGKVCHDYIESSVTPASEKKHGKHPTQKPLKILKELLEHVTNSNDIVLDPFMGSGSTCVAAMQLGRRYIGIELNKTYFDIAQSRINELKNKRNDYR